MSKGRPGGRCRRPGSAIDAPIPAKTPPRPYELRLTATAETVYRTLTGRARTAESRGDRTSAHVTALNMVDHVLDTIIPHDPIDRRLALSGSLSNVFRYTKGRIRICWISSSERREVAVLFISDTPRREGDARDPYDVFERLVASGQFDSFFDQLGVTRPRGR